jgi:hypothetical protein
MKKYIIAVGAIIIACIGLFYFYLLNNQNIATPTQNQENQNAPAQTPVQENNATSTPPAAQPQTPAAENNGQTVIGKSVDGRDITAYNFGSGDKEILLVGGIHGGYSWNTALLAYQIIDYLKANPGAVPSGIKVTVIPVLNPDGLAKVVSITGPFAATDVASSQTAQASGRFNAHTVDLNRNFDCGWKASAVWQNKAENPGANAFSEPESIAIQNYAQNHKLAAVIGWYAAGGGVYVSECDEKMLPESEVIMNLYARNAGYSSNEDFKAYSVSGDMTDWFSKNDVPAIGVLLTTHTDTELSKNEAGLKAIFDHYSK